MIPTMALFVLFTSAQPAKPLALHPENPHYFLFRGKPSILVTSGEHYGAVLNADFDYVQYLDALQSSGLNLTRTFTGGTYVEPPGAFKIKDNTLAPAAGRYLPPWARSDQPGYAGGGNKFDLSRWNEDYFRRLKDFIAQAGERGIVVEVNLFCPFYEDAQWRLSPLHSENNINGEGKVARTDVYTLDKSSGLLAVQEALVRKLVAELEGFDNIYYEICNEPYFGGVTLGWQHHIADLITDAEKSLPARHLISQNVANGAAKVDKPHPAVSIFNFHYATPPDAVALNYGLGKVIGDNETGFAGVGDAVYRMEGWDFLVAGGGLFNNLDYSFTVGKEDGSAVPAEPTPGGGSATLRKQLRFLKEFLEGFEFVKMKPDNTVFRGDAPAGMTMRVLAEPGQAYAIYLRPKPKTKPAARPSEMSIRIDLPAGKFRAEWFSPETGTSLAKEAIDHPGGERRLAAPAGGEDLALRIRRSAGN
jgi:hypothetical protein